jgi:hypothetical protein
MSSLDDDLDSAVAQVYAGPLGEFVNRRDALVKSLRTTDRVDEAKKVKALRKPSRTAWALNAATTNDPEIIERVATAVGDVIQAQSGRGDLRAMLDRLREAVRAVAVAASESAAGEGHSADQATLSQAVSAVIGDAESLEALRLGRLAAIPTASGLDMLASLPPIPPRTPNMSPPGPASTTVEAEPDSDALISARRAVDQTEIALKAATDKTSATQRSLHKAEINAAAADEQLRLAEQRAEATRAELDRARTAADDASVDEGKAADAAAKARAELDHLSE